MKESESLDCTISPCVEYLLSAPHEPGASLAPQHTECVRQNHGLDVGSKTLANSSDV
jgi:hypothetical protein